MLSKEITRFLIIGLGGLTVDLVTYAILINILPPSFARIGSIVIAMTFTWLCNRTFTFEKPEHKSIGREYSEYVVSSMAGALTNYVVFLVLANLITPHGWFAYVNIAISSVIAAAVNFVLYKFVVFKPKN